MTTNLKKRLALGVVATVVAVGAWWHGGAVGQTPQNANQQIIAEVNGVPITRQELAEELITRFGNKQLELYINRRIIEQECAKRGIVVTEAQMEAELRENMRLAGAVSVHDFEKLILAPRKMTMYEYRTDRLRPGILMRRLAGSTIKVTEEELQKAFTSQYGEKVQCRLIVETNHNAAMQTHSKIAGKRDNFMRLAQQQADRNLATSAGQINPIGRYTTHDIIERRAFEMKDDEVSDVIQTPEGGYVILLREKMLPADPTKTLDGVREKLHREMLEKKAEEQVPALFKQLRTQAKVRDYLNDRWGSAAQSAKEQMQK